MLVLSAAWLGFKHRSLLADVDLGSLLRRTIAFLGAHSAISRTCRIDRGVLKRILRSLSTRLPQPRPDSALASF